MTNGENGTSTPIKIPELGESVTEATIIDWLKAVGDRVAIGDILLELETDKVNLEVGAEAEGRLASIDREAGEDVAVGEVVGSIEPVEGGEVDTSEAPQDDGGDLAEEGVGKVAERPRDGAQRDEPPSEAGQRATPVARRMASKHSIDLSEVEGSGAGGRITKSDVQRASEAGGGAAQTDETDDSADSGRESARESGAGAGTADRRDRKPAPASAAASSDETRERMSRRRRTIAARLVESQRQAAMLTTFNDVDLSAVLDLRREHNPRLESEHGIKLGIATFFIGAAVLALREYPRLNASIDDDEIVYKHRYHIGVAVGAEEGLVVPVVRDADRMSLIEIEQRVRDLARSAREGGLGIDDLRGGTFTITNGGVFGSLLSTPILNPPEVAILGLHRFEERPVARDGQVVVRPMMYLALSYDHRLVDGREAVGFLDAIKQAVEAPVRMLLGA